MAANTTADRKHAATYLASMIAPLREVAILAGLDSAARHLDAAAEAIRSDVPPGPLPYSSKDKAANPPG